MGVQDDATLIVAFQGKFSNSATGVFSSISVSDYNEDDGFFLVELNR